MQAIDNTLEKRSDSFRKEVLEIAKLWNPELCPEAFLPYIAWSMNIEIWNPDWSIEKKRRVLATYIRDVRSQRGTKKGLLNAFEKVGFDPDRVRIREWYEEQDPDPASAFTFSIEIEGAASSREQVYIRRICDNLKPARTRYAFSLKSSSQMTSAHILSFDNVRMRHIDMHSLAGGALG